MLETVVVSTGGRVQVAAGIASVAVYLNTHSILRLSKETALRQRAIDLFSSGADLMFSTTNAAELARVAGRTSDLVKSFLDGLGPHWVPVDGNDLVGVLEREQRTPGDRSVCIAEEFLDRFFAARSIQLHGEQREELVGPGFFTLSTVMDWLAPQRADIDEAIQRFESRLSPLLRQLGEVARRNPKGVDTELSMPTFDPDHRAEFVWQGLLRCLIAESRSHQFKRGDALDLCHATIAIAYAHFATLDTTWKRRGETLSGHGLARLYGPNDVADLIDDVEKALLA